MINIRNRGGKGWEQMVQYKRIQPCRSSKTVLTVNSIFYVSPDLRFQVWDCYVSFTVNNFGKVKMFRKMIHIPLSNSKL